MAHPSGRDRKVGRACIGDRRQTLTLWWEINTDSFLSSWCLLWLCVRVHIMKVFHIAHQIETKPQIGAGICSTVVMHVEKEEERWIDDWRAASVKGWLPDDSRSQGVIEWDRPSFNDGAASVFSPARLGRYMTIVCYKTVHTWNYASFSHGNDSVTCECSIKKICCKFCWFVRKLTPKKSTDARNFTAFANIARSKTHLTDAPTWKIIMPVALFRFSGWLPFWPDASGL